ncbi:MAG: hypothetical protein HON68_11020 [Gammaproteobacteria bacterium]|mgnify:FL=1|jgi:hypothetical protein|nr:hypothetical protein [Gammaproteobacteria bacterium]MBT3719637.1 hypothetical protein [Gammaproteobacteria bacterium]MBT3844605.1 hypothetical protein [Gammaproteobacteria bacterium]MBT3891998.1 hypothetical protein [Gammaproteobacteria bacterium]MBT4299604.1 hypothetical protein [Gammaproteobacteria bacterium]
MFWKKKPQEEPWPEEQPIPLDHPLVPEEIRVAVMEYLSLGDQLHRVPTDSGVEWWLLDDEGELIDAFWV